MVNNTRSYLGLAILVITLIIFLALNQKQETHTVGVNVGDVVKYRTHYRGILHSEETSSYTDVEYYTFIEVLDRHLNNITFKETLLDFNETVRFEQVINSDPTKPHYTHPLFRVNDLFIPRGLTKGDLLPQTVVIYDEHDEFKELPWSQKINETVRRVYCGVWRAANHITWEQDVEGIKTLGTFNLFRSKNDYYDQVTGVLLESHLNSTKIYFDFYGRTTQMYVNISDYQLVETNLWSEKTQNIWVVVLTAFSLFAATIWISWKFSTTRT